MKKIVVIASVKNESDIIESFCRYNLVFSDCILIYENHKSSDNTREIIKKLIGEGLPIHFEAEGEDVYYENAKKKLTNIAVDRYEADLVVQLDADELLCHTEGINPRDALQKLEENVEYQIPWRTYIYEPEVEQNDFFAPENFKYYRNSILEEAQGHAGKTLAPRYLLKEKGAVFHYGGHWLIYPEDYKNEAVIEVCKKLVCAHYPIRSREQIISKTIPNYINKWALPEEQRSSASDLANFQLRLIIDSIKSNGYVSEEIMKDVSVKYSLYNVADREKIDKMIEDLGDELVLEGAVDVSFCKDTFIPRYTNKTDGNEVFLKAALERIDAALQHLDNESRVKTQKIDVLEYNLNETTRDRDRLRQEREELCRERDRLVAQIENIYASKSWKIGNAVIRAVRAVTSIFSRRTSEKYQPAPRHTQSTDIIICVHNASDDVKRCVESVLLHTTEPFGVIIVDDGSGEETREYLQNVAKNNTCINLFRNEKALGYTYAANIGMKQSNAEYVVLLNSDTIVTKSWLDNLIRCRMSDESIGIAGPLSNTASWQSVPKVTDETTGDWARNKIPEHMDLEQYADMIEKKSQRLYPKVPLLNGFCLLIHRSVIETIGYFDEENFGSGFGEEDDYNIRAGKTGFRLAIADDTYIYHAQSKSFTDEKRHELCSENGAKLRQKYGNALIDEYVNVMMNNTDLKSIRERVATLER